MLLYTSNLCQSASNLISSFDSCASDSKLDLRFITSWQNSKVFFPFFFSPFYSLICYVIYVNIKWILWGSGLEPTLKTLARGRKTKKSLLW